MAEFSLTALLRERTSPQPDATAHTLINYELDPIGLERNSIPRFFCQGYRRFRPCG
jgi:hypothetical protein